MRALVLTALIVLLGPVDGFAQPASDAGLRLQGLVSWNPPGENLYSPPYLDRSLAGIGPGFGLGVDRSVGPLVLAVEFSTASVEADLVGRSVPGALHATGTLRDSLLSVLAGARARSPRLHVAALAGVSIASGGASVGPIGLEPSGHDDPLGLTGGLDFMVNPASRVGLLISARYTFLNRGAFADGLEVGPHIVRMGVGVRIRVGS